MKPNHFSIQKNNPMPSIDEIIQTYDSILKVADKNAKESSRAYGGFLRSLKGKLQEYITSEIIKIAWHNLGGDEKRLEVNSKKVRIPIQLSYVKKIKEAKVREHILQNIEKYHYGLSVDKHIFIDNEFVMGVECKAYTENAMIKRILIDFHLIKTVHPNISCFLFQLESQLGGDYSKLPKTVYGSVSAHSIMSYFENVDLHIFTLLEGERKIDKPIHKFFKPLEYNNVERAVKLLESFLKEFV